ncbi:MAG: hypothetical protein IJM04_04165 [Prevotella sp.]|nr:hypothetical protein [Prevotella sp.]
MSKSGDLIYRPKGKAGEYAPFAFNGYTGCDHDCEYCFNKRGVFAHGWTNHAVLRKPFGGSEDTAFQMFQKEALSKHHVLRNAGIMFSFKTDPCLYGTWKLTWSCASFCLSAGIPVSILTKAVDWCYDRYNYPELDGMPAKGMAAYLLGLKEARDMLSVGFTLTGHDEMEPNAPSNLDRIEALAVIHAMGIRTYVSIEPVIDCRASIDMIRRSLSFVDLLKIGLRSGVPQKYYDDDELLAFVQNVNELLERNGKVKVYWKRTLRERLVSRGGESLFNTGFSVGADYKLFKVR